MTKGSPTTKPFKSARRSKNSCFFGCFGCSGEYIQSLDEVNPESPRRRWISKLKFGFKKSGAKNVPVVLATRKARLEENGPAKSSSTWEIQVVEEDVTLTKKPLIMVKEKHNPKGRSETRVVGSVPGAQDMSDERNINKKKGIDSVKGQNGSNSSRRKETKAKGAEVDSPKKKGLMITQPYVSSTLKSLTHATSLPLPKVKKPPQAPSTNGRVDGGFMHKKTPSGAEFDSLVGMSIILVTLLIMVLWGKVCAILCTSAWFFVAPRLGGAREHSAIAMSDKRQSESDSNLDLESVEYKKKVVLDGLLKRNRRNGVGRL